MRRAILFLTALLAGCATVPPPTAPVVDWEDRLALSGGLTDWRMTGRVAVAVAGDGGSAGVDWRQAGANSDVAFTGPLGVGSLRAVLDDQGLLLEDGAGERLRGAAAEAVLYARLGMAVPFDHLRYWLLGTPAPGEPYRAAGTVADGMAGFVQAGWTVGIARLEPVAGASLPMRLAIWRDDARLKLVVSRWDLVP
jgi:outer membrane lipoprotein LolB